MTQFYTLDFIFDDIPSHKFDLKIISFEDGSLFNGVGSSDVEILTQSVLRKSKPYYLGRTQPTVLQFPLTFGTHTPISGMDRDMISAWLFGRSTYKKLYILQDDLNGAYFNCFLTQPEPLYIGGLNYAFTCQVVCDSPWAYGPENVITKNIIAGSTEEDCVFEIYNKSSEDEYLYPWLSFSYNVTNDISGSGFFSMMNMIGNNARFEWVDVPKWSSVTVDNDLQIVSTWGFYGSISPLDHFNKKWFRLLPGYNRIVITLYREYDEVDFQIKWTERYKIGG